MRCPSPSTWTPSWGRLDRETPSPARWSPTVWSAPPRTPWTGTPRSARTIASPLSSTASPTPTWRGPAARTTGTASCCCSPPPARWSSTPRRGSRPFPTTRRRRALATTRWSCSTAASASSPPPPVTRRCTAFTSPQGRPTSSSTSATPRACRWTARSPSTAAAWWARRSTTCTPSLPSSPTTTAPPPSAPCTSRCRSRRRPPARGPGSEEASPRPGPASRRSRANGQGAGSTSTSTSPPPWWCGSGSATSIRSTPRATSRRRWATPASTPWPRRPKRPGTASATACRSRRMTRPWACSSRPSTGPSSSPPTPPRATAPSRWAAAGRWCTILRPALASTPTTGAWGTPFTRTSPGRRSITRARPTSSCSTGCAATSTWARRTGFGATMTPALPRCGPCWRWPASTPSPQGSRAGWWPRHDCAAPPFTCTPPSTMAGPSSCAPWGIRPRCPTSPRPPGAARRWRRRGWTTPSSLAGGTLELTLSPTPTAWGARSPVEVGAAED